MSNTIFKTSEGQRRFIEAYDRILSEWSVPFETMDLPTRFGTTHVIAAGRKDAPPLLLLHGMTFNSTMWRDNIEELSAQYRVYCVDVLGDFGKSVVTRPLQSADDCVQWLHDVLDALGLPKVHLLGHSMGGWQALNYALSAPERIDRLVLLAPVGALFRIPLKFMVKVYPALAMPSQRRIRRAWDWFLAKGNRLDETIMSQVEEAWTHCRILLKVIPKKFEEQRLRELKLRTLFLVGDEEVIYDARKAVDRVKELIPRAETHIIPQASHCLNAEQSELVNGLILQFLQASVTE